MGLNADVTRTDFGFVKGYDGYAGEKATRTKLNMINTGADHP